MWIRSQNKKALVNVDKIYIESNKYRPGCADVIGNGIVLGNYERLQDAVNVLNVIQNIIAEKWDNEAVYYMPQGPEKIRKKVKHKPLVDIGKIPKITEE